MKKVLVIGASGLLGKNIVSLMTDKYEVVTSSLNDAKFPADISNEESLRALFEKVGNVDAIICTAGMVNFVDWNQADASDWQFGLANKLMGQVNILRLGRAYVNEGGAIVLTTGLLAQYPIPGSSIVSAVNAAVEAAIAAVKVELDDSVRIGAVSPGWVAETMSAMGMDPSSGTPAAEVASRFIDFVESGANGDIVPVSK